MTEIARVGDYIYADDVVPGKALTPGKRYKVYSADSRFYKILDDDYNFVYVLVNGSDFTTSGTWSVEKSSGCTNCQTSGDKPTGGSLAGWDKGFDYAAIVENKYGGRQSHIAARYDLIPADVLQKVAGVLAEGAKKYGEDNWKKITVEEHINHAIAHLFLYLQGDTSEAHLLNATCRVMFAEHVGNNIHLFNSKDDNNEVSQ